jgi:hypothetical protein
MDDKLPSMTFGSGAMAALLSATATPAICSTVPARGQVTVARPELLSGVWESASGSGVDGILIMIAQGMTDGITREAVQVRVEHSQLYGRSMEVVSADTKSIVLQNEAPNYQTLGRFTGVLSSDGNSMTGQWNGRPALWTLRRIP